MVAIHFLFVAQCLRESWVSVAGQSYRFLRRILRSIEFTFFRQGRGQRSIACRVASAVKFDSLLCEMLRAIAVPERFVRHRS